MILKKRNTKKIKVIDGESSVHAKAIRLRKVREMAQLSRRTIQEQYHINFNTFKGWEVERHGGLTLKGAKQILPILHDRGIWCSAEWLLYGIGPGPQKMERFNVREQPAVYQHEPLFSETKEEKNIVCELQFFRQHTPHSLAMIVTDDAMEPFYEKGEYVAGIRFGFKLIKRILGQTCIVQTRSGRVFLRELRSGSKKGYFNLVATNPKTTVKEKVMKDIAVTSVAPVLWVRRKSTVNASNFVEEP